MSKLKTKRKRRLLKQPKKHYTQIPSEPLGKTNLQALYMCMYINYGKYDLNDCRLPIGTMEARRQWNDVSNAERQTHQPRSL